MSPAPKITDTQSLYSTVGEIHGKVETLVAGQEALFTLARENQQGLAVHKEYCDGVQSAKTVKEAADEKAQSRRKAFTDTILTALIIATVLTLGGACYTVWAHVVSPKEIVNPK
jgi:hypothetical protein